MKGNRQAVILIYSRPHKTEWYRSISQAAQATGISKWRILRGLQNPYGEIPNTRPVICVDEAVDCPVDDISP